MLNPTYRLEDSNAPEGLSSLLASQPNQVIDANTLQLAQQQLDHQGWSLLRGFEHNLEKFSSVVAGFCNKLTFDPAREFSNDTTQKVNAGTAAIGLHIENGNTPFPPNMVAFYSRKSAKQGSQTTLCDGAQLYGALPASLKKLFSAPMQVSRTLPAELWKRYVANEHPNVSQVEQVTPRHLQELMAMLPGQSGDINQQDELHYQLRFTPLLKNSGQLAFANAILGPSFNYQAPQYRFADGTLLGDDIKEQIAQLAERFTLELAWQDGDMLLIDNTRVMHGRRAIEGNPGERQLVIAMGS